MRQNQSQQRQLPLPENGDCHFTDSATLIDGYNVESDEHQKLLGVGSNFSQKLLDVGGKN